VPVPQKACILLQQWRLRQLLQLLLQQLSATMAARAVQQLAAAVLLPSLLLVAS
jgi:hypothetical protein